MTPLSPAIISSVLAYVITSICAVVIMRRRFTSKRLLWLTIVIGAMPLLQAMAILNQRGIHVFEIGNQIPDFVDLFVSLLCLWAVHLINVESRDRTRTDVKLRLVESEVQPMAASRKDMETSRIPA